MHFDMRRHSNLILMYFYILQTTNANIFLVGLIFGVSDQFNEWTRKQKNIERGKKNKAKTKNATELTHLLIYLWQLDGLMQQDAVAVVPTLMVFVAVAHVILDQDYKMGYTTNIMHWRLNKVYRHSLNVT